MTIDAVALCPAQRRVFDWLRAARSIGPVFVLDGEPGKGRSTIARALAAESGAALLDAGDLMEFMKEAHPLRLEEEWYRPLLSVLQEKKALIVDDFDGANFMVGSCRSFPRGGYLELGIRALCDEATRLGAWLLFVGPTFSRTLHERAMHYGIPKFRVADQEFLFRATFTPAACRKLDFEKIYRFAPRLTARQIARAAKFISRENLTTEELIDYLRSQHLAANVDLQQVEAVDLSDLHGVDDVLEKLESNIILPLENDELSKRLNLTPRRGVLLYGPPGTGKTTIGRALAHRLKSKFFLIDGTFISGTHDFYSGVIRVFEDAKRNAPAVVFVDDSDVIFEAGEEMGLYRYLLTILDGIESEEAGQLTVVLTAMDIAHLPPALIRSGRVELWLEMKLPGPEARRRILEQRIARSLPEPVDLDLAPLISSTDGFAGADLRRLVEDAKNNWALAISRGDPGSPAEHFLRAAREIHASKNLLSTAVARASAHFAARRPHPFPLPFSVFHRMAQAEDEAD